MAIVKVPARLYDLMKMFYDRFPTGGFLHLVTDDENWETDTIVWCLMSWREHVRSSDDMEWLLQHEDQVIEMCTYILDMPEKHRHFIWAALKNYEKYRAAHSHCGSKG